MSAKEWPAEMLAAAATMKADGKSSAQIAAALGVSRNAVLGKFYRRKARSKPKTEPSMLRTNNERWGRYSDEALMRPHVYRTPRKLDMGPIVMAALGAVQRRRMGAAQ